MKNISEFPRPIAVNEIEYLFSVLPEIKPGYKSYREKINSYSVIGEGRFGGPNLILGSNQDAADLSIPSSPVFASGRIEFEEASLDITIHEEEYNQIEIDLTFTPEISSPQKLNESKRWNYSDWNPGDKNPEDNSEVNEFILKQDCYLLAVSTSTKKIWLHDFSSGVNHLIPLTNFYNELMAVKKIRDPGIALKPARLFSELHLYSKEELGKAFISYNKYMKRLNLNLKLEDLYLPEKQINKKHFFFRRKKFDQ